MTTTQYERKVEILIEKVRNREGVIEVIVDAEKGNGLNQHDMIVDLVILKVRLVPAQSDNDGIQSFNSFFWKEAKELDLYSGTVSLQLFDGGLPIWDPPA